MLKVKEWLKLRAEKLKLKSEYKRLRLAEDMADMNVIADGINAEIIANIKSKSFKG